MAEDDPMMTVSTGQGFTLQMRRSDLMAAWDGRQAGTDRLVGALMASDSAAHVMTEAKRAMFEAWFILAQINPDCSLLERHRQAVEVLEQGIADLRYALNITEEPGS
jgi:hypothetical protein